MWAYTSSFTTIWTIQYFEEVNSGHLTSRTEILNSEVLLANGRIPKMRWRDEWEQFYSSWSLGIVQFLRRGWWTSWAKARAVPAIYFLVSSLAVGVIRVEKDNLF